MKILTQEELDSILADHKLWLESKYTKGERADLRGADLRGADIDFSCLPFWCGSLRAHFDDRQLRQIAYHLVKAGLQSKNASHETESELAKLIDFANGFHRAKECGFIEKPKDKKQNGGSQNE